MSKENVSGLVAWARVVLPIVATIIGAGWRLNAELQEMKQFGWTLHDQREWAREVKRLNPTVIAPDPNDVFWGRRAAHGGQIGTLGVDSIPNRDVVKAK